MFSISRRLLTVSVGFLLVQVASPIFGYSQGCSGTTVTGLAATRVSLEVQNDRSAPNEIVIESLDRLGFQIAATIGHFDSNERQVFDPSDWSPGAESLCLIGVGFRTRSVFGTKWEVVRSIPPASETLFAAPVRHGNRTTEIAITNSGREIVAPKLTLHDGAGNVVSDLVVATLLPSESRMIDLNELVPESILDISATVQFEPATITGIDLAFEHGRLLHAVGAFSEKSTSYSLSDVTEALVHNSSDQTIQIRYHVDKVGNVVDDVVTLLPNATVNLVEGNEPQSVELHALSPFGAVFLVDGRANSNAISAFNDDVKHAFAVTSTTRICGGDTQLSSENPYSCGTPCLGGNCTAYAWQQAYNNWGGVKFPAWGNARYWGAAAIAAGYNVTSTCVPGAIAVSTTLSDAGHVAWTLACDFVNKKVFVNDQDCFDKVGKTRYGKVWNLNNFQFYIQRPTSPAVMLTATGSFGTVRNVASVRSAVVRGGTAFVNLSATGSTDGLGRTPQIQWFVDGAPTSNQFALSTTLRGGTHSARLEVTSSGSGLKAIGSMVIDVQEAPFATLTVTAGNTTVTKGGTVRIPASVFGTMVSFSSAGSLQGSAPITSFQWFRNGTLVSTQSSFSDRFFLRGTHNILLRVMDRNGLFADATATLIVY